MEAVVIDGFFDNCCGCMSVENRMRRIIGFDGLLGVPRRIYPILISCQSCSDPMAPNKTAKSREFKRIDCLDISCVIRVACCVSVRNTQYAIRPGIIQFLECLIASSDREEGKYP